MCHLHFPQVLNADARLREWKIHFGYVFIPLCVSLSVLHSDMWSYKWCYQVDPSRGKIVIDGVDISEIGVYDLRSRMVSFKLLHRYRIIGLINGADVHTSGMLYLIYASKFTF